MRQMSNPSLVWKKSTFSKLMVIMMMMTRLDHHMRNMRGIFKHLLSPLLMTVIIFRFRLKEKVPFQLRGLRGRHAVRKVFE